MDKKFIAVIAVIVIIIAAVGVWAATSNSDNGSDDGDDGDSITVTDYMGRDVTVNLPVERVALTTAECVDLFAAVVGEGWENYVCMWPEDMSSSVNEQNALFEQYPQLADLPKCPSLFMMTEFPTETILATEPDLIMMGASTVQYIEATGVLNDNVYNIIDGAGAAVIVTDFTAQGFTEGVVEKNVLPLGEIFGQEERAQGIVDFYNEQLQTIYDIADRVSDSGVTVYAEIMGANVNEPGQVITTQSNMPEMSVLGMDIIIESGSAGGYATYNYEALAAGNPDYILIWAQEYYGDAGGDMFGYGQHHTDEELQALADEYKSRTGWNALDAVKDGHVIFLYSNLKMGPAAWGSPLLMAKMIWPEETSDIDPIAILEEFYDLYMPLSFDGTWSYMG